MRFPNPIVERQEKRSRSRASAISGWGKAGEERQEPQNRRENEDFRPQGSELQAQPLTEESPEQGGVVAKAELIVLSQEILNPCADLRFLHS